MRQHGSGYLIGRLHRRRGVFPLDGQFELTYRCQYDCVHCYCKGSEDRQSELSTGEVKRILDDIQKAGSVWLTLTGGDPLVRRDFLEIYAHAKKKGFLVGILTNGFGFNKDIAAFLAKSPPFAIEITLNGITPAVYESVIGKKGALPKVFENIKLLRRRNLPVFIKSNCLKENKDEITLIKKWVEEYFGAPTDGNYYYYSYDAFIYPRLNGDKTPCGHRMTQKELTALRAQDGEMSGEYSEYLACDFPPQPAGRRLYPCNSWKNKFFIDPFGRLKFCVYSDKFSADLRKVPFEEAFYDTRRRLARQRFKTRSECAACRLRDICFSCPAIAFLETGDEEAPVPYFCAMVKDIARRSEATRRWQTRLSVKQ